MHDSTTPPDEPIDPNQGPERDWNGKISPEEHAERQRIIRRQRAANSNRRPGKGKSALKQAQALAPIRCVPLSEQQIQDLRKQNAGCDLAIAQAAGSAPGSITVWSANGERSSLLVWVVVPSIESTEETSIVVYYVDGGTEWDRKQRLRKEVVEVMNRGQELGYNVTKL